MARSFDDCVAPSGFDLPIEKTQHPYIVESMPLIHFSLFGIDFFYHAIDMLKQKGTLKASLGDFTVPNLEFKLIRSIAQRHQ